MGVRLNLHHHQNSQCFVVFIWLFILFLFCLIATQRLTKGIKSRGVHLTLESDSYRFRLLSINLYCFHKTSHFGSLKKGTVTFHTLCFHTSVMDLDLIRSRRRYAFWDAFLFCPILPSKLILAGRQVRKSWRQKCNYNSQGAKKIVNEAKIFKLSPELIKHKRALMKQLTWFPSLQKVCFSAVLTPNFITVITA